MFEKIEIKRDKNIKRLKIEVKEGGVLLISAPTFLSESKCLEFMMANEKTLLKMIEKKRLFETKKEELRGHFLYLGRKIPLTVDSSLKTKYFFDGACLSLKNEGLFGEFLKEEAKRLIVPKAFDVASFYGVEFCKISFRDAKSRWGSCNSKKSLSFNKRAIGAPKSVIEYIVIHEICHLIELNHSSRFWSKVQALAPSYKESERWLKDNGSLLLCEPQI